MTTKSFIKTIGEKGLLADYNTAGKKLQTELTVGDNITISADNVISADKQIFLATYGVTTYNEVSNAMHNGVDVFVKKDSIILHSMWIGNDIYFESVVANPTLIRQVVLKKDNSWSIIETPLQPKLTFDTTPKAGSTNPVTSGGINTALDLKANAANFAAARGAKGFMLKSPKGLNLYDGVFINILNAYGGKAYRNITFAIRKEGAGAPQVERYNTDVSANTFPGGKNFSVYYGTYQADPNTNIILIVPSNNIYGLINRSSCDPRATWTILYDTPDTTGLSSITPIEHSNVFGANKGSASVPVYVDANGKATPCTDDFVHDSDLDSHTNDTTVHITEAERKAWNAKQSALDFDDTPTSGSTNPVTSEGIRTMQPLSHRFDNETSSRLIIWGKADSEGYIRDIIRKFGLQYGYMTDFLFANSVHKDNTTSVILNILNDSSIPTKSTKRLKASIFKDSSENSYFALWLDGSIPQPGWALYADYYPDITENNRFISHFTVFNPSEYTLVRDLTIKYIPLALPTPSAGVLTSNGSSNSWLTPPASGNAVLKSVNGVLQWVTE